MDDLEESTQPLLEQSSECNAAATTRIESVARHRRKNFMSLKIDTKRTAYENRSSSVSKKRRDASGEPTPAQRPCSVSSVESKPGWKYLFVFTTTRHYLALTCAAFLSVASGLVSPALAIFLGRVFDQFSYFGAGEIAASQLRHYVRLYSIYLGYLGFFSWGLNGAFFAGWLMFGELQAKDAQHNTFDGLSSQRMDWYDTRKSGIRALLTRLQT